MGHGKARNKNVHVEVVLGVQRNPGGVGEHRVKSPVPSDAHSSRLPRGEHFRVP